MYILLFSYILLISYSLAVKLESTIPSDIALIHVPKTGGTTVKKYIWTGRRRKDEEDKISQLVNTMYHNDAPDISKHEYYIVVCRHPLERMISWFLFSHPKNRITEKLSTNAELYDCYDKVNEFATYGLNRRIDAENKTEIGTNCQSLAKMLILGRFPETMYPNYYTLVKNYQWYIGELLRDYKKKIYVVRTEYLWDDMQKINSMLGGGNITKTRSVTYKKNLKGNIEKHTNKFIGKKGKRNSCYFLCREIQLYKKLLSRAMNLNENDLSNSLSALRNDCPYQTNYTKCTNWYGLSQQ